MVFEPWFLQFILDEPSWSRDESDFVGPNLLLVCLVVKHLHLYLVCCSHARVLKCLATGHPGLGEDDPSDPSQTLMPWESQKLFHLKCQIRSAVPTIGATLILFSTSLSIPSPSSLGDMNIMDMFPQFPSFIASCTTTSWA